MFFICCSEVGHDLWALSYSVSRLVHDYMSICAVFNICVTKSGVPLVLFLPSPPSLSTGDRSRWPWLQGSSLPSILK